MYSNRLLLSVLTQCVVVVMLVVMAGSVSAATEGIDTTKVRDPEPVERSCGEHLLHLPVYIVKFPIWLIETFVHFLVNDVYADVVSPVLAKILTTEFRPWGFYPIVGYNSDAGFKFGGAFRSKGILSEGERLKARFYYSTNEYQAYRIRYNAPNLLKAHYGITFETEYNKRTRESFYGIGPVSREVDEVSFGEEEFLISGGGLWTLGRGWQVNVTGGYRLTNVFDGDDPGLVNDLDSIRAKLGLSEEESRNTRFVTSTAILSHDNRDSEARTTRGGYRELTLGYNIGVGQTDGDNYWQTRVDVRQFFELFNKRVIAVRLAAQQIEVAGEGVDVPFYLRSGLGGFTTLRGFRNRRLVDNDFALVQVEYRWPILDLMDAFIFLDEGRVFNDIAEKLTLRDWKYSTGGGLRLIGSDDVTASILLATSDEGPRFYIEFSETF